MSWLQDLIVFFVAFPFVLALIAVVIMSMRSKMTKQNVMWMIDGTAAIFWFSIMSLLEVRDPGAEPWMWFVGGVIVLVGLLLALQYRVRGKVNVFRVLRGVWRVGIPVSFIMYIWTIVTVISENMDRV